MDIIRQIEQKHIEEIMKDKKFPSFRPGDTIRVITRIKEGDKEKLQPFEGVVIAIRGSGINKTFTVRKVSYGVGIERIYPYYSPNIVSIEIIQRGKVRRAKLYYLRGKIGKKARVKKAEQTEKNDKNTQ